MNLHRTFLWCLSLLAVVTSCGCVTGPHFAGPRAAPPDAALLYIFRPSTLPLTHKPTIVVNDIPVAHLPIQGYFDLQLPPGSYTLRAHWSWYSGVPDSQCVLQAEPGQTYYLKVDSAIDGSGVTFDPTFPVYQFKSGMGLVPGDAATAMLTPCVVIKKVPGAEGLIHPQ